MKWLLLVTFGFFGLHALLWLPRGFAERRRHAASPDQPPAAPGTGGSR
jgi:hypothetical protein